MSMQPGSLKHEETLQSWNKSTCTSGCSDVMILALSKFCLAEHHTDVLSKMVLLQLGLKQVIRKKLKRKRKRNVPLPLKKGMEVLPHDPPRKLTKIRLVPSQQLQLVPKEDLLIGARQRVFYHVKQGDSHDVMASVKMHHGIWDGDAVVHVKEPRCGCPICEAAERFNDKNGGKFERGDHLYTQCEDNLLRRPMYHHGIYDGKGYVYHFAHSSPSTDLAYEKCEECRVRGVHRREILSQRGLGRSGVRKSCLSCFAEADPDSPLDPVINFVQYGVGWKKRIAENTVPGRVSTRSSRPREEVVNKAKMFYDDNSFGEYSTEGVSHNCEAFAYFCKTGVYGAKQVTRSLLQLICEAGIIFPVLDSLLVLGAKACMHVRGYRKILQATREAKKANKLHPNLVPAKLVCTKLYILKVNSDTSQS